MSGMMTGGLPPLLVHLAVGLTLVGWVAVLVACFLWDREDAGRPASAYEPLPADRFAAPAPDPSGEPDLARSTSAEALEEIDRLEALWALPAHEANSSRD